MDTNDRFDSLTNLDISTHYRDRDYYFNFCDFMGAFSYWVVSQSPYEAPDITRALEAFSNFMYYHFDNIELAQKFSYDELSKIIHEDVFESISEIEKLNHAKIEIKDFNPSSSRFHKTKPDYDFIDLGALARNVFYMMLRENITQSLN